VLAVKNSFIGYILCLVFLWSSLCSVHYEMWVCRDSEPCWSNLCLCELL